MSKIATRTRCQEPRLAEFSRVRAFWTGYIAFRDLARQKKHRKHGNSVTMMIRYLPYHCRRATLWHECSSLSSIDSPHDIQEFTERVLYEPYWLTSYNEEHQADPQAATEALLETFDQTFCQYREISRHWIVIYASSDGATKQAAKWAETYQNFRFMTVDEFKAKVIEH